MTKNNKNTENQNKQTWDLKKDSTYHFMGIGGVAMGNIAVDLVKSGYKVTGSDVGVYSPMKEYLEDHGIKPMTPYKPENIDSADLIIVGNAISRGNPELEAALNQRKRYTSMSEFLRLGLLTGRKNIVVTGTHGKTSTTALAAFILEYLGYEPGYMIGGVPLDLDGGFDSGGGEYFVIEGDEYDIAYFDKRAKFLQYLPYAVIINCIEFDHGDIYNSLDEIQDAFRKMVRLIPENGLLAVNGDDPNITPILDEARCRVLSFGKGDNCDYIGSFASNLISVRKNGVEWGAFTFIPPGEYNMMNSLGVIALMDSLGIDKVQLIGGLEKFHGVRRRMEFVGEANGISIYDDFAHHPTAVGSAIASIKAKHPGRRIWAIFQPRSNTSVTNVFQDDWVNAFEDADCVVIAELHRKQKIPKAKRLSRDRLKEKLGLQGINTYLWNDADEIAEKIQPHLQKGDIVLIMSNSDFGGLPLKILHSLN